MLPLISVIIPVYKVEDYLQTCVESVLAQTYKNTEIILVDDGSPDNCPHLCDEFAKRDSRIRVIHKENGGLSSARNAGIDIAKGDFIAFLDSDDLWSPLFLERLYCAIIQTGADFSVCLFRRFYDESTLCTPAPSDILCLTQQEAFKCLFDDRNENMVIAPNKLYRARLFRHVRYPLGRLHEDEAVIHRIIGGAQTIAWLEEAHYFYRQTPDSITSAGFSLKRLDEMHAKEDRITYFEEKGMQELADRTRIVYLSNLMRLYRTVQQELQDRKVAKQACAELYQKFCQIHSRELMRKGPGKMRMRCMLFKLFPTVISVLEAIRLDRKDI